MAKLNLQPEQRVVNGKTINFYSLTQLEAITPPEQRLPEQRKEQSYASSGTKLTTHFVRD